ncbi:MAG: NUDIX hydrolase [Nanoarchaeota archaeon]
MIYRPTAAALVYRVNAHNVPVFLAVQKPNWDKNEWGLVQGKFDEDADGTLENAIERELREELGTTRVGPVIATGLTTQRSFSPKTLSRYRDDTYDGKETTYFVVEFGQRQSGIALGSELSAYRWFGGKRFLQHVKYAHEIKPVVTAIQQEYGSNAVGPSRVRREYLSAHGNASFKTQPATTQ